MLEGGSFILGENVKSFEKELADFCGTGYAVGVASGSCDPMEYGRQGPVFEADALAAIEGG